MKVKNSIFLAFSCGFLAACFGTWTNYIAFTMFFTIVAVVLFMFAPLIEELTKR